MSSYFKMSVYRIKQVRNFTNLHGPENVRSWHKADRLRRREVYYERGAEVGTFSPTKVTVEIVHFTFSCL